MCEGAEHQGALEPSFDVCHAGLLVCVCGWWIRGLRRQLWLRGGEDQGDAEAVTENEPTFEAVPPNPCKLFVGNLPMSTSDDELKTLFESVGPVVSVDLKRDKQGRCKGFAMVELGADNVSVCVGAKERLQPRPMRERESQRVRGSQGRCGSALQDS